MSGPDISALNDDLPVPQEASFDSMSVQEAGEVCLHELYCISYIISCLCITDTRSERILMDHQRLKAISANDLRDLIRNVLKNPEFNADEVDQDMHSDFNIYVL